MRLTAQEQQVNQNALATPKCSFIFHVTDYNTKIRECKKIIVDNSINLTDCRKPGKNELWHLDGCCEFFELEAGIGVIFL